MPRPYRLMKFAAVPATATAALVAVLGLGSGPVVASADASSTDVWLFGDSIARTGWIETVGGDQSWGWAQRTTLTAGEQNISVTNDAVGGMAYDRPGQPEDATNTFLPRIQATFAAASGRVPDVVVIAGGTNDIQTHATGTTAADPKSLAVVESEMTRIYDYLKGKGVSRVVFVDTPPYAHAMARVGNFPSLPDAVLPILNARVATLNAWLDATWLPRADATVVHLHDSLMGADGNGNRYLFIDGIHPNFYGHLAMWKAFPVAILRT